MNESLIKKDILINNILSLFATAYQGSLINDKDIKHASIDQGLIRGNSGFFALDQEQRQ